MQGDENDPPTQPEISEEQAHAFSAEQVEPTKALEGYAFGKMIGKGGIGEVVEAHDLRIGRDVAIKRLRERSPTEAQVGRFLREARIQARLEHPAIPPVHELGLDPDGRPYFAMKRLSGVTLNELLASADENRARMLRAVIDVCHAIEFAHERGVVHADLKPSNIIVGNFGDTYLIDWGLARVVGEAVAEVVTDDIDSLEIRTGDLLGTPGYMAPEQLQRAAEAGRPADIYALGSILFEILGGEPLHPRGADALPSTLGGEAITSPTQRRPDRPIAPELDAVCVAMLQMDPMSRPTAKVVAESIQAYLDGDRDVVRRKRMATDLVWTARAMLDDGHRAEAMRSAGRALSLDPEAGDAAQLVTALMLEPPKEPPPELVSTLREAEAVGVRRHATTAIGAYLAIASFLPLAMWNGVQRWDVVLAAFCVALAMAGFAWRTARQPHRSFGTMLLYALGNVLMLVALSRMAGPFTFVPGVACVIAMSSMAYPAFTVRSWVLILLLLVGILGPIAAEQLGLLSSTFEIRDGELISHAGALRVSGTPTLTLLIVAYVAMVVVAGISAARIYRANRDARIQLAMQAWHLRQLLPR
jgi:serine/threonine-protein kinase